MNDVTISGKLIQQPAYITTKTGRSMARFSVAVYAGKTGDKYNPSWFINCNALDEACEKIRGVPLGERVTVSGSMGYSTWSDKDGNSRSSHTLWVRDVNGVADEAETEEPF